MNFGTFLGNEALKERLSAALAKGQLSHSYLLTGPAGAGKHTLAQLLAAAMECEGEEKPCLRCVRCKKVLGGIHPDVIFVEDPDKKSLSVKQVRQICSDLYIRPNEGRRKIYIFPRAHDLNPQSQNALLKCMEEPPEYGVFLLLSEHAERLLPTVRSRCVELRLSPLKEDLLKRELTSRFPQVDAAAVSASAARSGGYLGQAISALEEGSELLPQTKALTEALVAGSPLALLEVLVPMERMKRDSLQPVLAQCLSVIAGALSCQKGAPTIYPECGRLAASLSSARLLSAADAFRDAQTLLTANVSAAHICGTLAVRLDQQ